MIQFYDLSQTTQRFFGVILLLPMVAVFWSSAILAQIIFVVISVLMFREVGTMARLRRPPFLVLLAIGGLINLWPFAAAIFNLPSQMIFAAAIGFAFVFQITAAMWAKDRRVGDFCLLLALCVASGSAILAQPEGRFLLLMLAMVIASCDSAAYFVGRALGGPQLAPAISPNKTISGALGGIVATLLTTLLLFGFLERFNLNFYFNGEALLLKLPQLIVGGLVIGVLAQIGDLLESALKRRLGVKDSSQLIPGHGGVLDRFDGYLLTLPASLLFFILI